MTPKLDKPSEYFRGAIARGVADDAIDRTGGDDGAGLIRGVSVNTLGEALGHYTWLDEVFLAQTAEAINASADGVRARFTHPSLSGDGLGKFLGRAKNARLDGDQVRADLHISTTAHETPDGDLAKYVMDLAAADPKAFGTSISFRHDQGAEREFEGRHSDENGAFKSPDKRNTSNYYHARLAELRAVDTVDDPAANPGGLFHRGDEIAAEADKLLAYSLGLTDEAPELAELGIDPDRGAGFVQRFLKNHGLDVQARNSDKETVMAKDKSSAVSVSGDEVPTETGGEVTTKLEVRTTEPDKSADTESLLKQGRQQEQRRQTMLRELAGDDVDAKLLARAIDEDWDQAKASAEFLKDIRGSRPEAVRVGSDHSEEFAAAVVDSLMQSAGEQLEGRRLQNAEQFSGIGLQDLGRICMQREGKPIPHDIASAYGAAISTTSLPTILGDTLQRTLHKAYSEYPGTFTQIAASREVKDFRQVKDVKLSEFASVEKVNDAGELKHDTLTDSAEMYAADTYGKMFGITRKTWFNDDLGALTGIPAMLGRADARNRDELGFALLISASGVGPTLNEDSVALFSTARATPNYKTGATASALGATGLSNAKLLMRKIKYGDVNINVKPRFLLVPPELEHTALTLVRSQEILAVKTGSTDATTLHPTANVHQNSVVVLIEARLSDATNGETAWYLVADPRDVPSLVFVYLRGNRLPTIERADPPKNVLGIGWRMFHDAGVGVVDWRGIVRSKGA